MANCYSHIDIDSLVPEMYVLASEIGRIHPTDLGREASLKMYNGLLDALASEFDGDITPTLASAIADPSHDFHELWKDLKKSNLLVRTVHPAIGNKDVDLAVDPFGASIDIVNEVFAKYEGEVDPFGEGESVPTNSDTEGSIGTTVEPSDKDTRRDVLDNDTISDDEINSIFPEERASEEDLGELPIKDDTKSIRSLIRDLLGSERAGLQDNLVQFFQNIISTSYVDNQVIDGKVKGFISTVDVAETVQKRLENITNSFIANSANEKVAVNKAGDVSRILYFEPGRPMGDAKEVATVKDRNGDPIYTEYSHPMMFDEGTRIVVGANPDEDIYDIIEHYAEQNYEGDVEGFDVDMTHESSGLTIDSNFGSHVETNKLLQNVFFSNAILKGNNYDTFLKAFNQPLHESFKNKSRTGHGESDTFSAADQDSKTIQLLKTTTPRLLVDNHGVISQSKEDSFLTEQDFNAVASKLHLLPRDVTGFRDGLKKLMLEGDSESDVYTSIYYRFFHPGDYTVSNNADIVTGRKAPATFRSMQSILQRDVYNEVSSTQYLDTNMDYDKVKALASGNKLLGNAMSAMITSLSSTTPAEKFLYKNDRGMTTNTRGGEVMAVRKQDIISRTTQRQGSHRVTSDRIVDRLEIVNASTEAIDIRIKQPGSKGFYEFTGTMNGINSTGAAKNGRILQSVTTTKDVSAAEMQNLARQFNIPTELTNPRNIPIIKQLLGAHFPNEEGIFNNYFTNMIMSIALNGKASNATTGSLLEVVGYSPDQFNSDGLRYDHFGVNHAFREATSDILMALNGRQVKKFIIDNTGNKLATLIPKNKVKDTVNLVKKLSTPNSLHASRLFTSGNYIVGETYSKTGIALGADAKGNSDLTRLEQNQFLIEGAFLGRLQEDNWKSALLQMGTMSDRSDIQLIDVKAAKGELVPMKDGALDITSLKNESFKSKNEYFKNFERIAIDSWSKYLSNFMDAPYTPTNILDLKAIIDKANIPFDKVQTESGLIASALLGKRKSVKVGAKPNPYAIHDYLVKKGFDNVPEATDSEALYAMVDSSGLDFDGAARAAGLSSATVATIPNSAIQNIALFKDEKLAKEFVEENRKVFRKQMDNIRYTSISRKSANAIGDRFGFSGEDNMEKARDILLDSYYYYSSTLGNELLDMHTGGYMQFKSKGGFAVDGADLFNFNADGTTSLKSSAEVRKQYEGKLYTDDKGKQRSLKSFGMKTAVSLFGQDSEEVYQLAIIKNKKLSDAQKAKALFFSDLNRGNHDKFVDQVKRNAGMGSSNQLPRLAGKNEAGVFLSQYSHNITVDDPTMMVKLLGKSYNKRQQEQDIYDAVQMAHPLYFLKLNGSLGDTDSNFRADGVPVKDITNEVDNQGWFRFQKKATFDMFNNELLKNGSNDLYNLFVKMNTAMGFTNNVMMVPTENRTFNTITMEQWLRHGTSLGLVRDNDTGLMVDTTKLVSELNISSKPSDNRRAKETLKSDIDRGRYSTIYQEQSFNSMQELWEHFGAFENDNAWREISELLGRHTGDATTIDLADATYANRDNYIEKVGFLSQEKSGSKNIVQPDTLHDPSVPFISMDTGIPHWSTIDNTYHGVILQAEHSPDTTGSMKDSITYEGDHHEDSVVSLITQIISANVGQGESVLETTRIYDTLNALSSSFLGTLADKINREAQPFVDQGMDPEAARKKSVRNYVTELVRESLKTREDAGTTGEIMSERFIDRISYDLKMTLPLAQSSINSTFNRNTVRMKFKGGQFVVAPSHDYIKTFEFNGRKGLNRNEINNLLVSVVRGDGDFGMADEISSLPDHSIATEVQFKALKLSDLIVGPNNEVTTLFDLKKRYKSRFIPEQGQSFDQMFMLDIINSDNYSTKLVDAEGKMVDTPLLREEQKLNWQEYFSYSEDENGELVKQNILDTDQFQSFYNTDRIVDLYKNFADLEGEEYQLALAGAAGSSDFITKGHFKAWYFNVGPGAEAAVEGVPTPAQEEFFDSFYTDYAQAEQVYNSVSNKTSINTDILQKAEAFRDAKRLTFEWVGSNGAQDPMFRKTFETELYNTLEDRDGSYGWVAEPAEFYMPSLTYKAFYITKEDNLMDILGPQEMPDSKPLVSMGIISTDEAFQLDKNEPRAMQQLAARMVGAEGAKKAAIGKYLELKEDQLSHMREFFKDKVEAAYGVTGDNPVNNAFIFKNTNLSKLRGEVRAARDKSVVGSDIYNAYTILINNISDTIEESRTSKLYKTSLSTAQTLVDEVRDDFIESKVARLANNFPQTLEFITARIPAQGKQSFVAAKTKNFVHHTKNSCYGPLEMLTITGADYDIDKQNMMAWSIDNEGNIVDWKPYLNEEGTFNRSVLEDEMKTLEESIRAEFSNDEADLRDKLVRLNQRIEGEQDAEKLNALQTSRFRLEDRLEDLPKQLDRSIANMTKAKEKSFVEAGQNYVVYNLMKTIRDPKNAIEAATPVSMDKVGGGKLKSDYSTLTNADSMSDYFVAHEHALPYDPYTFTNYERINMDGKVGIGIFASDLKAYFATYYAFINSTESEQDYVQFRSGLETTDTIDEEYGIQKDALQFFTPVYGADGKIESVNTQNITELANSAKHMPAGKALTGRLDKLRADIKVASEEDQVKLLTAHINDLKTFDSMNVEEQAWEDLSELLSAATDNAKELILGRIGATGNTNSIISTMVRLGVDLKDALFVINHPTVKPIVASVEDQSDLRLKAKAREESESSDKLYEDSYDNLEKALEQAVESLSLPSTPGASAAEYLANPIRQVLEYTKIAGEFSIVAKMLSINQGLPNGAFESWNFIDKIDASINKVLDDEGDEFSLRLFLNDAIKAKVGGVGAEAAESRVQEFINRFDANKKGINVLYILNKNSHYFSYFEAAFAAKEMRDDVSTVFKAVEDVIKYAREDAAAKESAKIPIDENAFKRITDFVYSVGVQKYFTDSLNGGMLRLHGESYDLSNAEGRLKFLEQFPDQFSKSMATDFEGNPFTLFQGEPLIDYATKKKVDVLRGPDLLNLDSMTANKLDNGLNSELDGIITDPELYDALFAYGLIVSRGGYNKGSFIGLFKPEKFMQFADFINANSENIASTVKNIKDITKLSNPSLVPSFSTSESASRFADKGSSAPREYDEFNDFGEVEMDPNEGMGDEFTQGFNRRSYVDVSSQAFDTKDINQGRIRGMAKKAKGAKIQSDVIRSKQTGLLYSWDKRFEVFVPLVRDTPDVAIPFNISKVSADGTLEYTPEKSAGYSKGWSVNLEGGATGRILTYVDHQVKNNPTAKFKEAIANSANVDLDAKYKKFYLVEKATGAVIVDNGTIEEYNPGIVLDKHKVIPVQEEATYDKTVSSVRSLYRSESGRYYAESGPGRMATTLIVDVDEKTTGNNTAKAAPEFMKENVLNKFTSDNTENYPMSKVQKEYNKWREDFLVNAYKEQGRSDEYIEYVMKTKYKDLAFKQKLKKFLDSVAPRLSEDAGLGIKFKTLEGGKKYFDEQLKNFYGKDHLDHRTEVSVVFPKGKRISAKKHLFSDSDSIGAMNLNQLKELVGSNVFDKYMKQVWMPSTNYKMVSMSDGRVYTSKDVLEESMLDRLDAIESREIKVPDDLRAQYSKDVSPIALKRMMKYMNSRFPETKFKALTSLEIERVYGERLAKSKGFVLNGEVVINTDNATLETPIHEFTHIYLAHLKESDRELYDKLMTASLDHSMVEHMAKAYPELQGTDLGEEVFVELTSLYARGELDENNPEFRTVGEAAGTASGLFGKVKQWFNRFFGKIFGSDKEDLGLDLNSSLNEAIKNVGDKIAYGEGSILKEFSPEVRNKIRKLNTNNEINIKEAKDLLKTQGFIQYRCN